MKKLNLQVGVEVGYSPTATQDPAAGQLRSSEPHGIVDGGQSVGTGASMAVQLPSARVSI